MTAPLLHMANFVDEEPFPVFVAPAMEMSSSSSPDEDELPQLEEDSVEDSAANIEGDNLAFFSF